MSKGVFSGDAWLVLGACFCFMSCHTMIIPVLAGFTGTLGGSAVLMGMVVGMTNLVSLGFRLVSGNLAARVAGERLALWGMVGMLAGCLGCAVTPGTGLLVLARVVHGVGFACCSVGLSTWFSMLIPRERLGSGMGIYGTVQAVGLAVAPSLGISVERWVGYRPVFWGAVLLAVLAVGLILVARGMGRRRRTMGEVGLAMGRGEKGMEGGRRVGGAGGGGRGGFRVVVWNVVPVALIVMLFTIPYTATQSFLVSIVKRAGTGLHAEWFFSMYALALMALRVGLRNYFDRVPYRRFLGVCTGCALVSMGLLAWGGSNVTLLLAAVCMAGGFGIMCSESQATAMAMVPMRERGLANSTYLIGLDSGMALGPMIGGALFGHVALGWFYPVLMGTAVLGGVVYAVCRAELGRI